MDVSKTCTRCGKTKPLIEMTKDSSRKDGFASWCKTCSNEDSSKRREDRQKNFQCCSCGDPISDETHYCIKCTQDMNESSKKTRKNREELRLCLQCGEPSIDGNNYCDKCKIIIKEQGKYRYTLRKECGLCIQCGEPAIDERVYCAKCGPHHNKSDKKLRDTQRQLGVCIGCGEPAIKGKAYCGRCQLYKSMSSRIRDTLKKRRFSKNKSKWETYVDYSFIDLCKYIDFWKGIQGLEDKQTEIHHINSRFESKWREPGDEEWCKLWQMKNLIPLTRKAHDAVHRGDYSDLHPKVKQHIMEMRVEIIV